MFYNLDILHVWNTMVKINKKFIDLINLVANLFFKFIFKKLLKIKTPYKSKVWKFIILLHYITTDCLLIFVSVHTSLFFDEC